MEGVKLTRCEFMDVNGTHYVGEVEASFEEMVAAFGSPHHMEADRPYDESGEKVRCEWGFRTGRFLTDDDVPTWAPKDNEGRVREILTLYDWKEWRQIGSVRDWHIGGHTPAVVHLVVAKLEEVREVKRLAKVKCPTCGREAGK